MSRGVLAAALVALAIGGLGCSQQPDRTLHCNGITGI